MKRPEIVARNLGLPLEGAASLHVGHLWGAGTHLPHALRTVIAIINCLLLLSCDFLCP